MMEVCMKNTQFSLTTLGEILIDFTPIKEHIQNHNGNPCFEQNPGGAPANVLACFAKLGGKASFIGAVGRDSFGSFLKNVLDEQNINSEGLIIKDNADTTLAFVHLSENGDRSFSFYRRPGADTQIAIEDVPIHLVEQSDIFHFGTLSLTNEPSRSATLYAVQKAAAAGCIISFDPNWRAPLWASVESGLEQMRCGLTYANLLKVSEEEAEMLTGISDPVKAGQHLLSDTTRLVVVTLGPRGCAYCHKNSCGELPTFDIKAIDTTGAGDSFWGALLYRFLELGTSIDNLSKEQIIDICTFANASGSLCASRRGAIPGLASRDEIDTLIKTKA